jgi:[ribosomal protein S18]-alanine N-acetyltransferase
VNPIEVRRAGVEDVEAICSIQAECQLSPWPRLAYEAEVDRKDAIILIAATNLGVAAGFITGRIIPDATAPAHAEIYNLGVLEAFRLRGVGSGLLREFIDICETSSVSQIFLEVRQSNRQAIGFYRAHNFLKIGQRKNFYADPIEDAEIMTLTTVPGDRA